MKKPRTATRKKTRTCDDKEDVLHFAARMSQNSSTIFRMARALKLHLAQVRNGLRVELVGKADGGNYPVRGRDR